MKRRKNEFQHNYSDNDDSDNKRKIEVEERLKQ